MSEEINIYKQIERAKSGDENALNELISANIALVKSIAARFLNRGVEFEDLVQIGSVGLIKAIQRFDTDYEVKLSTYAVPVVSGEIKRFLRDNGPIKISRSLKEIAIKASRAAEEFCTEFGRDASVEELAERIGFSVEEIVEAMDSVRVPVSLDDVIYEDNKAVTVKDCIEDKTKGIDGIIDRIMLKQMLLGLSGKERQIIVLRYFQDKTQSEVAKALDISQVQVSRLESRIIKTMREKIG